MSCFLHFQGAYEEAMNEFMRKAQESGHEVTPTALAEAQKKCWKEAAGGFNKDRLYGLGPLARNFKPSHAGSSSSGYSSQYEDDPPPWVKALQEENATLKENYKELSAKVDCLMNAAGTQPQSLQRPPFPIHPQLQSQVPQHPYYQAPVQSYHQVPLQQPFHTPFQPAYQPHIPLPHYPTQPGVPQYYQSTTHTQSHFMGSQSHFTSSPSDFLGNSSGTTPYGSTPSGSGSQTYPEYPITTPEVDATGMPTGMEFLNLMPEFQTAYRPRMPPPGPQ